jgi:hypothetical protein
MPGIVDKIGGIAGCSQKASMVAGGNFPAFANK